MKKGAEIQHIQGLIAFLHIQDGGRSNKIHLCKKKEKLSLCNRIELKVSSNQKLKASVSGEMSSQEIKQYENMICKRCLKKAKRNGLITT